MDIYVYDLERGVASRLTTAGNNQIPGLDSGRRAHRLPIEPDRQLRSVLATRRWKRGSRSLDRRRHHRAPHFDEPRRRAGVHPPGSIADRHLDSEPGSGEEPAPFLATADDEANPVFSPDGKWIAYELVQGNRPEIFVVPYPAGGRRIKISIDGGVSPVWSRSSQELFYMERGERMMVVAYEVGWG